MQAVLALALAFSLPLGVVDPKLVQKLEKQLKDKDPQVRAEAAWDLGRMKSVGSVPALTQALNDSSSAVRANAAASLWKLGEASEPAIPALQKALDDRSAAVVGNAAGALKELGVPKAQMIPQLKRLLARPDCEARVIGAKRLAGDVPPLELFDHAWDCLDARGTGKGDAETRHDALETLRKIVDRRDHVLVPRMLEAMNSVTTRDASDLTYAIGRVQPPPAEAVPVLAKLIDTQNAATQKGAIHALGELGAVSMPALPRVVACLQSCADGELREASAEAIGRIGPKAVSAVPALMKAGESDKLPSVRKQALTALGEIGPGAKEAVPVLRAALKDPDGWISMAARNSLFRIDPSKREEVSAISDKSRPVQKGRLFDDLSQMQATLPGRVPQVFELHISEGSASAIAPSPDTKSGRGAFHYEGGAVTGPKEESARDCKKTIALAKVDFSVVPKIVKETPGLLGAPSGKVTYVGLGTGVFCKSFGWMVLLDKGGSVDWKIDGTLDKVRKD